MCNESRCIMDLYETHPDISDFLFSFSTLPTYVSLRDRLIGNWFIQEFTSTLDEFAEKRTLSDMMSKVRRRLIHKTTMSWAQMSVDHSMLSRKVFFSSKDVLAQQLEINYTE